MSELEAILRFQLRARGIAGLFTREYEFSSARNWKSDFACLRKRLLIECEGGTWSNGRHVRGKGFEADCRKYNEAVLLGWRVLRFTRDMIESGEALTVIEQALGLEQAQREQK